MRYARLLATGLLALAALVVIGGPPALAAPDATITVNSASDSNSRDGVLTLREAMLLAVGSLGVGTLDSGECGQVSNSTFTPPCTTSDSIGAAASDIIVFDTGVFPSGTPATITLSSPLPTLSTGNDTVSGAGAGVIVYGVISVFHCFVISGESSDNNTIEGLQIKRCIDGVRIEAGADNNIIGGTTAGERNVISDNTRGVHIRSSSTTGNTVKGNYIGTDTTGAASQGNTFGVLIDGTPGNTIGGTTAGDRNVISGNNNGVFITGVIATGNQVQGNYIGTDQSGTADLGNVLDGVAISVASSNTIGGTTAGARNVISGNNRHGVSITGGATGNQVQGNYIGTDQSGTLALGNTSDGVRIEDVAGNTVGGTAAGARNVISGNSNGVFITGSSATGNDVQGNYIGTDQNGTGDLGNSSDGVVINGAPSNTIGGTAAGARNVISGNDSDGIEISGGGATGNDVQGNYIGTDQSGALALGNTVNGVMISGAPSNIIGGTATGAGNVISGNAANGIEISGSGATGNQIQGNLIGTSANGAADLGNTQDGVLISTSGIIIGGTAAGARNVISGNDSDGIEITGSTTTGINVHGNFIGTDVNGTGDLGNAIAGVRIDGAPSNAIGGTATGERNIISANDNYGIEITGIAATGNDVQGNYIGTDVNGTADLGNSSYGVIVRGAPGNMIGGTAAGAGNVISGNNSFGVYLVFSAATSNRVEGNLIGTDVSGTADLGNASDGLRIAAGAFDNTIGGTAAGAGNVISGNSSNGIQIDDSGSTGNVIQGNYIGTDITGANALGNSSNGVYILISASDNIIGGTATGEANIIAYNGGDGVRVDGASTTGNSIRGNSIHSNGGLGIENISGGNTELARPVIVAATVTSTFGTACANCTIDVFSDDVDEGRIYHGFAIADGSGNWTFLDPVAGPSITATTTEATGNTSEFAAPPPDNDNDGVLNASDNCPFVPNGASEAGTPGVGNQTNTDDSNELAGFRFGTGSPPPILAGDALGDACDDDDDNDGFDDADERIIFGVGPGSAEERTPCRTATIDDPWPPDTFPTGTPDRLVDGQDLVAFLPAMFAAVGPPPYNARLDIFQPGTVIDGQDLVAMLPYMFNTCQPPP